MGEWNIEGGVEAFESFIGSSYGNNPTDTMTKEELDKAMQQVKDMMTPEHIQLERKLDELGL